MYKLSVLAGCALLAVSAYAADPRMKTSNTADPAVAMKQVRKAPARIAAATPSKPDQGDSRSNDYRVERESCCGPQ
ncbi:MAG: hypothetical protein WA373_12760 [Burkholderiales bacterium]